ncbi:MAG: bifunctional phosphopantothenoylcysteine decarboxylase/phosphopantothenate--cysteine ligase CoaBC [Euryarchaeota archaeon]|nr:bifunctional phosphopantothenoylcysteine decarboxylase/phosphopantothenate--cysteine ligase CoaBC [Euryarchaeota archaeon]
MREMGDLGVEIKGDSLKDKRILLGITGGIAATQGVKLLRELRRFQCDVTVIMTESAQKIITPLAISWAGNCNVITDWEHGMAGLNEFDGILITPATRNILAKIVNGIIDSPILMALSAAKSNKTPVMIVPSMHSSMANDEITIKLNNEIKDLGFKLLWGNKEESKFKQPSEISIVANFSNHVNSYLPNRKNIVITLGSTVTYIDDIRYVKNSSTGKTGYEIASKLHRWGHEITIVSGQTNHCNEFELPLVIKAETPENMLLELKALTRCSIDVWIHAAAVLDYVSMDAHNGKIPSGNEELEIKLFKSKKHLEEIKKDVEGSFRIGFKLESNIRLKELISKATSFVISNDLDAVIANRLEDLHAKEKNRAHLILKNGEHFALSTNKEISNAICKLIENN